MAVFINNQNMSPIKLDPTTVYTPSNYNDSKSVIGAFRRAVQIGLEDPKERSALFAALKKFLDSMIVEELMDNLKVVLDAPEKRVLYRFISPLIPSRLRSEYKSLVPHIPSFKKKIVRLKQQGNYSYGFSVRGGKEYGCGIYVTNVVRSSLAAQAGLVPGDQVIRVNGLITSECTHEEFINLIKNKRTLALAVKVVGMIPEQKESYNKITWKTVGEKKQWQTSKHIGIHGPIQSTKRIQINLNGNEGLGASVKTSSAIDGGILIVNIVPNSPADHSGLKRGNEIIKVNDISLIGKTIDEAKRILKSSNSLMMTLRVDEVGPRSPSSLDTFPVLDYEFRPNDFDIDMETLKGRHDDDTGFILKTKQGGPTRSPTKKTSATNRISIIDSEVESSKMLPSMGHPAMFGFSPTPALPTIMGMANKMSEQDNTSPIKMDEPFSPSVAIPLIGRATVEGQSKTQTDLSGYQFPVDEDNDGEIRKPSLSGNKKTNNDKKIKRPSFNEKIEIIPHHSGMLNDNTQEVYNNSVHPSNLSFSPEILQGRKVEFHSIPKNGPLKLAIRGGTDTPLGPQIIISRIIEGGAAHSYGKLNVGDQILVCDGIGLIDVSHDEAGQAFKRAMDLESVNIDLVVAVNPDAETT